VGVGGDPRVEQHWPRAGAYSAHESELLKQFKRRVHGGQRDPGQLLGDRVQHLLGGEVLVAGDQRSVDDHALRGDALAPPTQLSHETSVVRAVDNTHAMSVAELRASLLKVTCYIQGVASDASTPTAIEDRSEGAATDGGSDSRINRLICKLGFAGERDFVLRVVQPALVGLIDGTVSSLAPIFAAAVASSSRTAFLVGVSTALGAGVSMGWSEALSDTGEQTGRGSAVVRGAITGGMTALGGMFHTLPFLISNVHQALIVAGVVVAIELFAIAWIRNRFLEVSLRSSLLVVTVGGAIVLGIGVGVGSS
jgi:erythrin-vacuolar iron transport family protein